MKKSIHTEEIIFTDEMVNSFARLSGDENPIHLDEDFAKGTIFKEKIVHGAFATAIFSRLLGMVLPGLGTIYLGQNTKFLAPVFLNEPYIFTLKVINEKREKSIIDLETKVERKSDQTLCVIGNAVVKNIKWFE